jgi:hypothetical protein
MANIHLANITLAITMWGSPPLDSTNPQPTYYDNRERIAVKMTFEWTETSRVQYPVEFIRRHNEMTRNYLLSLFQSAEAQDQSVEVSPEELDALMSEARIDEKVADMVFETSAHYLIERELRRTRIRARQAVINLNEAKVSEQPHESEIYLQDSLVITVFCDSAEGTVSAIHLAQCDGEAIGYGSPTATVGPELLVLYAGVSPFRLFGRKPEDWRLVSVSPQEWVFELPQNEQRRTAQEGEATPREDTSSQLSAPHVRFHLNRQYQDALSRLEVRYPGDTVRTWRILRYKLFEGVWFPSEIEYTTESSFQKVQERAVLIRAGRTQSPITIQVPTGTPVFDYRRAGMEAWTGAVSYERKEWSESLLKSFETPAKEPAPPARR